MKILLAEDDRPLGDAIQAGLTYEGLTVDWFQDGISADSAVKTQHYDVAILDICMPGRSGIELLQQWRSEKRDLPVLILTALGTVNDRVTGLDVGADDYLVKPFDMEELLARLRALVRRSHGRTAPRISRGNVVIFPDDRRVELEGKPVDLSRQEFMILSRLMENLGRTYSERELVEHAYSWNRAIESNAVQVHISHLRKKLGKDLIRTRRGLGYVIEKPDQFVT